jgi:hypothetical protein
MFRAVKRAIFHPLNNTTFTDEEGGWYAKNSIANCDASVGIEERRNGHVVFLYVILH